MKRHTCTYDVVVIGGGLAGFMAAAAARKQGAEVAILAEGGGVLELSSGSIDLLGRTQNGNAVVDPWEAMAALTEHPYHILTDGGVREGLGAFMAICKQMGLTYTEAPDHLNQITATAVGATRPTYLLAPGAASLRPDQPITIIGLRGLKEFHPGVVADGLQAALPGTSVTSAWIDLPQGPTHPVQVARQMENQAYRTAITERITAACRNRSAKLALLPAVLGLESAAAVRDAISQAVGAQVGEVPLLSPSLPGLRLATAFQRYLNRIGVEHCLGVKVTGAAVKGGCVESVTGLAAGGAVEYRAQSFVLAAGGLLGGGLEASERTLHEPVFGLPVAAPEKDWASAQLLAPEGHAFVRAGIRVERDLRPTGWTNLYICGKMLAGYDPYAEGSGGGVAAASGWRAGILAGAGGALA